MKLQSDYQALQIQNAQYKKELGALDDDFWQEVLSLKRKYAKVIALLQQSQRTNKQLQKIIQEKEQQLQVLTS